MIQYTFLLLLVICMPSSFSARLGRAMVQAGDIRAVVPENCSKSNFYCPAFGASVSAVRSSTVVIG